MNQIYLYKSVAKTISYDDTHWYLNGVPKRLEGDDSSGRIKQFAIDEAYKALQKMFLCIQYILRILLF